MIQRPSSLDQLPEVWAQWQQMRESQPVAYDEATASWHLFGYQEVERVLTDPLHFAAGAPHHALSPIRSLAVTWIPTVMYCCGGCSHRPLLHMR